MMKCPVCNKPVERSNPEYPFCSERCRMIDLGNWAMGRYAIPGEPLEPPDDEEE
ncbi:MAG: DNA gyrase inhibitor YacG [Bryobacterales bacterium]|nr:DNA gyrase inhibitor YacG [Bryobacterales bacterium]